MTPQDITTVPKDRRILLKTEAGWCEGIWDETAYNHNTDDYGAWYYSRLPEHGCGCCSATGPEPTAWMELP